MTETSQKDAVLDQGDAQVKCKKRDRSASEERLLNAGREIFSKHGFDGATTKMIAKKADVN
ncbi:MAG TPA: TetR/AcrR family transcriptional regulator, partial [Bdellovibrio sp.]